MSEDKDASLPDLSTIVSKVMENPQALSMLSSLLGGALPVSQADAKGDAPPHPPRDPPHSGNNEKRKRLLLALKPFLSEERCRMIDRIIMITEAISLLERKGGGT